MYKEQFLKIFRKQYPYLSEECLEDTWNSFAISFPKKNTLIAREGSYFNKILYILKGGLRVFYLKDGKDISFAFLFENEYLTAIDSLFGDIPSAYSIEALEDSVLFEISKNNFYKLSKKYSEFEKLTNEELVRKMFDLYEYLLYSRFNSAKEKYDLLSKKHPQVIQRVPLTHIASYLGIALETLSRVRKSDLT